MITCIIIFVEALVIMKIAVLSKINLYVNSGCDDRF